MEPLPKTLFQRILWFFISDEIKELEWLAYYDTLTQLPNRLNFKKRLSKLIDRPKESRKRIACILIDVDDFKRINDTLGHVGGDDFLIDIGKRLQQTVDFYCKHHSKPMNPCQCFVARLGGDEFVMVLDNAQDSKEIIQSLDYLYKLLEPPFTVEGRDVFPSMSSGVSLYPYDGTSISALLKSADLALYAAKDAGKKRYYFHESSMNTRVEECIQLEQYLLYFIDTGDFDIDFQPQVDINTGKVVGGEALFRGNKKTQPNLNLGNLISVAEETGLIVPLGKKILERACMECKLCMDSGREDINISVNASMRQLEEHDFVPMVLDILDKTELPPERLTIEITETIFMQNFSDNVKKLEQLAEKGIQVVLDDFGTGYSSMGYIRRLPISGLKLDIQFISNLDHEKDAEISKAIILMAKTLGLTAVAEGVETKEQVDILRSFGCDKIQGYYYSKPLTPQDFCNILDYSFEV